MRRIINSSLASQVIKALKDCQADIISLQEVDIGCARSAGRDTGKLFKKEQANVRISRTRSCISFA